jgi:DNA-binding HxlR family transcriptional regulator
LTGSGRLGGRSSSTRRPGRRPDIPAVPSPKRHPYDQWAPDARALDLVGDKWTLLIVRDLVSGPRRFVELQRVLPGISTEQLRSRLNRMVADGLLTRQRYREVPPRVDYELTERSRALVPVIAELARWGYRWSWGHPRPTESIDIGAIFRATPGLLADTPLGLVELRVDERSYWLGLGDGPATVHERGSDDEGPDATISGSEADWIAALGPAGALDALTVTGDMSLAERVFAAIAPTRDAPAAEVHAA